MDVSWVSSSCRSLTYRRHSISCVIWRSARRTPRPLNTISGIGAGSAPGFELHQYRAVAITLLPLGEGGAKRRMRVGVFIDVDTRPDPHPCPSPKGRGVQSFPFSRWRENAPTAGAGAPANSGAGPKGERHGWRE